MDNNNNNSYLSGRMRIRGFKGFTFKPEVYESVLNKNLEYLGQCQLLQNFNSEQLIQSGAIVCEQSPHFYLYQQNFMNLTTFGLLAELNLEDYISGRIRKHEKTLKRVELNHLTIKKDHVGPVIVGYDHEQIIDEMIMDIKISHEPFATWSTIDGRKHKLWRSSAVSKLVEYFQGIEAFYILDGHHRFEASCQYLQMKGDTAIEKDYWIQGLVYSTKYVRTFPQHRKLLHSEEINVIEVLRSCKDLEVTEIDEKDLQEDLEIILLQFGKFFKIHKESINTTNLSTLSVEKLDEIIKQNFGYLRKSEADNILKFVPSIVFNPEEYIKGNENNAIFLVKCPSIKNIFEFADRNQVMPPKSTWLEPKPCMHMVIRLPH